MSNIIAVIAAHPDDEVLGCGGTIAKHVAKGDSIHLLILADGEGARQGFSNQDVANRNQCLHDAAKALGIHSVDTENFPDNQFDTISLLSLTQAVEKFLSKYKPNIVYSHSSTDLNIDHQCTARAVLTAARPQPQSSIEKLLAFEVLSSTEWHFSQQQQFRANYFVDVTDFKEQKLAALNAYKIEMRDAPHTRSFNNVKHQLGYRGHSVGYQAAEAFEIVYIRN